MQPLKSQAMKIENWVESIFKNAQHISPEHKKLVTKCLPWVALIIGVIHFVSLFVLFNVFNLTAPFGGLFSVWGVAILLTGFFSLFMAYFFLMSFSPLQANKKLGRNYFFYGLLFGVLNIIVVLCTLNIDITHIFLWILCFYLLFEVKNEYK